MKKNLKIVFIIILILALLIPITYSYALSVLQQQVEEKQFFEISKTEVTKNEKVEMIINLDSIKYNEFTFELKSDEAIENLKITQNDEIKAEKNNNEIVMEINKAKTNVKTISLLYSIPENKNIGDTIKFIATITSIINNEGSELPTENEGELSTQTTEVVENNLLINDTEKVETENQIDETKTETQSIELEIKIIEEKSDNNQEVNKTENQVPNTDNNKQEIENNKIPNQNNESSTNAQKIPTNNSNLQFNSMGNISIGNTQVEKVIYNGSDNNYLSKLKVDGYTFNRDFSKEKTTYFITVEKDIESLDITAKANHDEATVSIYGDEDLKEGTNKILITVTAENGNVRNYRLYVTKNS